MFKNPKESNVSIYCLDYDGCADSIFKDDNGCYTGEINRNHSFITSILADASDENIKRVIFTVGSARQDRKIDNWNMNRNGNGSCFENYKKLEKHLKERAGENDKKIVFKKILIADIEYDLHTGQAMEPGSNAECTCDIYKRTIILSQVHYFAQIYNNKKVIFKFFDDADAVVNKLAVDLGNNLYALPYNVTFKPYTYNYCNDNLNLKPYGDINGNVIIGLGPILPRAIWRGFAQKVIKLEYNYDDDFQRALAVLDTIKRYNKCLEQYSKQNLSKESTLTLDVSETDIHQGAYSPSFYSESTSLSRGRPYSYYGESGGGYYNDDSCGCRLL